MEKLLKENDETYVRQLFEQNLKDPVELVLFLEKDGGDRLNQFNEQYHQYTEEIAKEISALSDRIKLTIYKGDLEKEKRVYTRQWAQREKQIERVITNTVGMYGDLQGLIGSSMQSNPALESGDEKTTEVENKKTENEEDSEVNIKDIPF